MRTQVLKKLQQELPHFDGGTLVFQPVVPRQASSRTLETPVHEEMQVDGGTDVIFDSHGEESDSEMSDVDEGRPLAPRRTSQIL